MSSRISAAAPTPLPASANLRHLRLDAKRLVKAARQGDPDALARLAPLRADAVKLADAQAAIAREHGFASWALLKLRIAEIDFTRAGAAEKRLAFIDAACAAGWDRASTAAPDLAEAMLAAAPELQRDDFLVACLAGEVDLVRAAIDRDPAVVRQPVAPRGWEPLLYVAYDVLLRPGRQRADGIVAVARLLLERGADPNCSYAVADGSSFPALYAAIAVSDNLALARLLLEAGANPNDNQSLYHAAERPDTDGLELLVAHGVRPADLSYCLLHKIDFQDEAGIRWFLDHGADPNARHPRSGESSLHWAIKRASSRRVIELLLERGADPDARTLAGQTAYPTVLGSTPLDVARRLGREDVVELLRSRGAQESPATPEDAFVFACAAGDAAAARSQLAADPGLVGRIAAVDRDLVAHLAQQERPAGVTLLLELGFDPSVVGWMGTALHWAACRGDAALARTLLARGAPMLDVGGLFKTPIHTVLSHRWSRGAADHAGVLEALVAAGAVVPEGFGQTGNGALDAALARLRG
jgi:ankyrin repeat protein